MDYHIVTGSKGGVGKTLLSLMLLAYFWKKNKDKNIQAEAQHKTQSHIIAIDLNAMNIDFWRVLKKYNRKHDWLPDVSLGDRDFKIIRFHHRANYYYFMFPKNPYITYDHNSFSELLTGIKKLPVDYPPFISTNIDTVIIDTNYHFCNLFAENGGESYDCFKKELKEDNFFIWFMWVYAQFAVLHNDVDDAQIIRDTAKQIEANFSRTINGKVHSPFLHVTSPASLIVEGAGNRPRLTVALNMARGIAKVLQGAESFKVLDFKGKYENYITFDKWLTQMEIGFEQSQQQDVHEQFVDALVGGVQVLNPRNIIRLMSYEKTLAYYADKDEPFTLDNFMNFQLYRELSSSLEANGL